ncbi:MAG: tetratricopeptide repeat protein [Polyangiaceae bacterium]
MALLRPRLRWAARSSGVRALLVAVALGASAARADDTPENWATKRARELTEAGEEAQRGGRGEIAVQRFRQAIDADPTFGQAYLDLGAFRASEGDLAEAERTYSAALEHIAGFADGFVARAAVRRRQGKREGVVTDLEAALSFAPTSSKIALDLVQAAIATGNLPLALGAARRAWRIADGAGDAASARDARLSIKALELLLEDIDPVGAANVDNPVRRAIARYKDPPKTSSGGK